MTSASTGSARLALVGYALTTAATCLLTVATLLALWIAPGVQRADPDPPAGLQYRGTGDVADPAALAEGRVVVHRGVPVTRRVQVTVQEPADADRLTYEIGTTVLRADLPQDRALVRARLHRVTVDRTDGMPVGEGINGTVATEPDAPSVPVHVDGLEVRWPVRAERRSYPYYDADARVSAPIDFVEETEREGVPVHLYRQRTGPADLSAHDPSAATTLPAEALGLPGTGGHRVRTFRTVERSVWVEPRTGIVVDATERVHEYLGRDADEELLTVLRLDLSVDEDSRRERLGQAEAASDRWRVLRVTAPSALAVLGGIGLACGVLAARAGRRRVSPVADSGVTDVD